MGTIRTEVTYRDFGKPVTVSAPPAAETTAWPRSDRARRPDHLWGGGGGDALGGGGGGRGAFSIGGGAKAGKEVKSGDGQPRSTRATTTVLRVRHESMSSPPADKTADLAALLAELAKLAGQTP